MTSILCYGDSNTWGCVPLAGPGPTRRFPADVRWPGVLRRQLGHGYRIVEAGLNGRTTVWDDPFAPHRNGRELLLPTLLTHRPLDVVIIMLGTNDLKHRLNASAAEIAEGAGMLSDIVAGSGCGPDGGAPETLLVCPPPLVEVDEFDDEFEGGVEKSRQLTRHFAATAEARSCAFVDAGSLVSSSDIDGVHLDERAHTRLGAALVEQVRHLVG